MYLPWLLTRTKSAGVIAPPFCTNPDRGTANQHSATYIHYRCFLPPSSCFSL